MNDSRIAGLYKLGIKQRIAELERLGYLSPDAARQLQDGRQVLSTVAADKMVENVFGVFGLPFAIAPNFIVNPFKFSQASPKVDYSFSSP